LLFGRRNSGEVRIIADNPAGISDPKDRRERKRKPFHIALERGGGHAEHQRQRRVSREQRAGTSERRVTLGGRAKRLTEIFPDRRADDPADQIDIHEGGQSQNKDGKSEDDGEPILVDERSRFGRARSTNHAQGGVGHRILIAGEQPAFLRRIE